MDATNAQADAGTVNFHQRVIDTRWIIAQSTVLNSTEKHVFDILLDLLEPIWRPPTEEEADASLERIATAEELAHQTACAAIRYVSYMTSGGSKAVLDQMSVQFKELADWTEKYEEAVSVE